MREILGISPHLPAETEVPTGPHPWRSAILDSERYSRFATLRTGQTVLLRFIKKHDREELARLFRDTPAEEARFLKYDVKAPRWLEAWTKGLNYRHLLPLTPAPAGHGKDLLHIPGKDRPARTGVKP